VYVIDDFLSDPHTLRAKALTLTYAKTGNYPGRDSLERLDIPKLDEAVSAIMRQPFRAERAENFAHSNCRLTLASDDKLAGVHVDPSNLSGILYLSRPEDCRGGTDFFRHIRTGTDRVPMTNEELKELGYSSYGEMHRDIVVKEGLDRSKWEHTMTVPMRFNRLVLLQPQYWHTAGPGFGDSLENGRLVYLMFFTCVR
ncbi:MAG TPA: DUF6445 family protein, partial [Sphingomicrobium sp.]|nr:DUF6445 family protein [Sphingomicrobium sp.]